MNLHERLGRKQEQLEALDASYTDLLRLLAQVVTGEVCRSRVLVNLTDRTWVRAPEGQTPPGLVQINGLPEYVVGPLPQSRHPLGDGVSPGCPD